MAVKYSISVVKRDPLVKIKVTGVYNENDQFFYYRNPVTGYWQKILGVWDKQQSQDNLSPTLELFKKVTCRLKNLTDRFYEDSKELFGGSVGDLKQNSSINGTIK